MENDKPGIAAAIAQLREEMADMQTGEQLSLLPTPGNAAMAQADDTTAKRDGPGRPAGSKNRSTSEWTKFISANYRDPRLFMADSYTRPVQQLAAELDCSLLEAFKIQAYCAKELLPYMAQKQPMAVQIDSRGQVTLVVHRGDAPAGIQGDGSRVINGEILPPDDDQENPTETET